MQKSKHVFSIRFFGGIICLLLLISSCEIINPEEEIPSYLSLPSYELITDNFTEGTSAHGIQDAWVFVGEELLGAYPLPATVPVLAEGNQDLFILAGIKRNGISATAGPYAFYEPFESTVTLARGSVLTVQPTTRYANGTIFIMEAQEGFEGSNHQLNEDIDGNGETKFTISNDDVFEGNGIGTVVLTEQNPLLGVGSRRYTLIPTGGREAYLEMNYKTDVSLLLGILGYDASGTIVYSVIEKGVNPKDVWNKIYFDFSEEIGDLQFTSPAVTDWQFCIHAEYNREQAGADEAVVKLDNVKFVLFD